MWLACNLPNPNLFLSLNNYFLLDILGNIYYNYDNKIIMQKEVTMQLKVGDPAPNFTLKSHLDTSITLSEFRGRNIVIAFYPLAFTPI